MTISEQVITIGLCVLATMMTRFLPFLVFGEGRETPRYVKYLGKYLPLSVFAMLVVYCLRKVNIFSGTHGLPEFISIILTTAVHLWKRQMLLSILLGTVCYMVLIRIFI